MPTLDPAVLLAVVLVLGLVVAPLLVRAGRRAAPADWGGSGEAVLFVVDGEEAPPGFRTVLEKRRIGVAAATREEAERELGRKAARLGANGVTGLRSAVRQEKYQAGVGPKGNPFFKTREVTEWEGLAVAAVPRRRLSWWDRLRGRREGKLAVIDGSNVLHAAGAGPDFESVAIVVGLLREEGWEPHLFFDANVGYKLGGRHASGAELARRLGLPAGRVTVVPARRQADPYVMDLARRAGGVVVTNDLYRDNAEMMRGLARLAVRFEAEGVWVG